MGKSCLWYIREVKGDFSIDWCYDKWFIYHFFANRYYISNLTSLTIFRDEDIKDFADAPDEGIIIYEHNPSEKIYKSEYKDKEKVMQAINKGNGEITLLGFVGKDYLFDVKQMISDELKKELENPKYEFKFNRIVFHPEAFKFDVNQKVEN